MSVESSATEQRKRDLARQTRDWSTSELEYRNDVALKLAKIIIQEAHKGDATALRIYREALNE